MHIVVCHFYLLVTFNSLIAVTEHQEHFWFIYFEHLLKLGQCLCDSGFVRLRAER